MIYLFICLGTAAIVIGGALIAARIDVSREMRREELEIRRRDLKVARFQKKIDSWNYANEILSKIEIESE
jgi:predicted HTH domain antitoxin